MASRSESFRAKVRIDPSNLLFQFSFGQALAEEGKEEEAVGPLSLCVEKKTDWMVPRILLGKCLLRIGEVASAASILNEALALAKSQGHEEPESEIRDLLSDI
ncbi:MAG: molecular chaperone DnaJ [Opitutales bacterium]